MKKNKKPPGRPATHGAHSHNVRKQFKDGRTSEAKALNTIMQNLVGDLGGESNLTGAMRIIINSNIRPKLITLMLINDYINKKQGEILNAEGELIACLSKSYISFSNALRLDLQALNDMAARAGKNSRGIPTIDELIQENSK